VPIAESVSLGPDVRIPQPELVNLFGCKIGAESLIGPFVEIQAGAVVGERCKISSHTFVCSGVTIGEGVFIGHGVMFTNDRVPRATTEAGDLQGPEDWEMDLTVVGDGASIGSGTVILPGIKIGAKAVIGAGAVVTRDVAAGATVVGNPARPLDKAVKT
jgi:UDP-2-acetamido-3-amino-2,3-dideoxy-glucuronate N-acetyltransferase